MSDPRVVLIGGGFGGLYLARSLARKPVSLTLVDRRNHHLFQPMLYQVATAGLAASDIAMPIRSVLRKSRNTEVILDEVTRIDVDRRMVEIANGPDLEYDYCVVATGANHSYFGHDDWEPFAPGLKSIEDALEIRRRVLVAFERAEQERDSARRRALLTFVIVGGGPTGVELAGAIAELRRFALARDFHHIDSREATVQLLEGGPTILPTFPRELAERAKRDLRQLGVEVREEALVDNISADRVEFAGWVIGTNTVIWAAGNRASPLTATLGAELDGQGRAFVESDCSIPGHPELFVIGDAAAFREPSGKLLPGVSQVAMQMGRHVARIILKEAGGATTARPPFKYHDKGQLAVIGRGTAVGEVYQHFMVKGAFAWLVWAVVHITFLIGFRNRLAVLIDWGWAYLRYRPGARLITGETGEYAARIGSGT